MSDDPIRCPACNRHHPALTSEEIEEEKVDLRLKIAEKHVEYEMLRRRADAALGELGNLIRESWPQLTLYRLVSRVAAELDVDRSTLYLIRDGKLWR